MANQEQIDLVRESLQETLEGEHFAQAVEVLRELHAADQADIVESLDREERERLVRSFSTDHLAEILEYMEPDQRTELLREQPAALLVPLLNQLDEDIVADILQELDDELANQVVPRLAYRQYVEELLDYPEESAGGRMSIDVVALRRTWTVEQAIQFLRTESPDDTHPFYLYVVDDDGRLIGTVSLRSLVTAAPETPIAAITREEILSVDATEDQEVAAERMRHYNLLALPVVDDTYKLRGVITADDVLDVQVQEATEDIYRMAGLAEEERIFRPIRAAVPPRLGWLMINMITASLAVVTVSLFEGTIERAAVLAFFMPLVAGMGGNAGIQTITLVVRSLALGEIEQRDVLRVLRHEMIIALIKGLVIGLFAGTIAYFWQDRFWLGFIVGLALMANILNATLIGVLVPLLLKRLRFDPALASGIFVTTFSDVVGFFVFLGLAAALITHLD